jgi:prolyl 4-hydroxylase
MTTAATLTTPTTTTTKEATMTTPTVPSVANVFDPLAADPDAQLFAHLVPFVRVVHDFLDLDACAALKARIAAYGPQAAPVSMAHGAVMRPEIRNNDRVIFDDVDLAASLFERARPFLPSTLQGDEGPRSTGRRGAAWQAIGWNERFRGYRYRKGQRFAPHHDGCFQRSRDEVSALTVLLYLDDGCVGGETNLLDWGVQVRPTTGTLFVFDHYVLHEGAVVTAGEKSVLRSDVMYRRVGAAT